MKKMNQIFSDNSSFILLLFIIVFFTSVLNQSYVYSANALTVKPSSKSSTAMVPRPNVDPVPPPPPNKNQAIAPYDPRYTSNYQAYNFFPQGAQYNIQSWNTYIAGYTPDELAFIQTNNMYALLDLYRKQYNDYKNQQQLFQPVYYNWENRVINLPRYFTSMGDAEFSGRRYNQAYQLYLGAEQFLTYFASYLPELYQKYANQIYTDQTYAKQKTQNAYNALYGNRIIDPEPVRKKYPKLFDGLSEDNFVLFPIAGGKDWYGKAFKKSIPEVITCSVYGQYWSDTHYLGGFSLFLGQFRDPDLSMYIGLMDNYFEKRYDYSQLFFRYLASGFRFGWLSIDYCFAEGRVFYFPNQKRIPVYNIPFTNTNVMLSFDFISIYVKPELFTPNLRWNVTSGLNIVLTNYFSLGFIYGDEYLPNYDGQLKHVQKYEAAGHFSVTPWGWGDNSELYKIKLGYSHEIYNFKTRKHMNDELTIGLMFYYMDK